MQMNKQLSNRDWEQLSAYIDESLSPRARVQLQQRLEREPGFAAALQQLQRTRAALRRSPQRRVPRSFALTRAMLGAQKSTAGWTSFNWASAVASILLVFTFIADFSVNGVPAGLTTVQQEAPQALMLEAANPAAESGEAAADTAPTEDLSMETYAMPEEANEEDSMARGMKEDSYAFDARNLIVQYARPIEITLAAIAILAAVLARRRRS
jgi:anti-sigma factor RsiW